MPKKTVLLFFLLSIRFVVGAQSLPSDSTLSRIFDSNVLLPLLTDSAIKNSAEISRMGKNVALFEQNLQSLKKSLLNNIMFNSSYGYGNVGSLAYVKDPTGINQLTNDNSLKTTRYNIGVSLQLPLGNFLTRKNATRSMELQIGMAENEKENAVIYIKQQVIKMYQQLKLSYSLMLTTGKIYQSAKVSIGMAQKNFVDGQVSVEQYSKMQTEFNQSSMEYETKKNAFQTDFLMLEIYTGVELTKLISRLK